MRAPAVKRLDPGYLLAAGAAAVPLLMLALYGKQKVALSGSAHFWPVVIAAGTAAFVAIGLTVAGVRGRDGRAILLGTAFSTTTALLAIHGFATPGVIVGMNGVIALAGGLSIPVGAGLLALTALPGLRQSRRIAPLLVLQAVLVFGLGCLAVLAHRAIRTHALTHRPTDLLVVAGCAWLGVSLFTGLVMGPGNVAFYSGHAFELGGIALIGIPTALDLAHGGASRPLVGDLTATELVAGEEAYLGMRVRSLLVRLADRDTSTEEHTRRVALLAARVAEELKLPAALRRDLAMGGLLHDIGKLSVPLEILQKPGPLTDAEFAEVQRHAEAGRRLLEELGGFPETVRRLVSDHHERLDGTGYPRGLQGCDLPIETRILAACDVYDALVSDRVYRSAWSPERALELLRAESGTGFDPKVVEALERIVTPRADEPSWVAGLAASVHRPASRPAFRRA